MSEVRKMRIGPDGGAGVHWFVAWRYLLARPRRLSGPILAVAAFSLWQLAGFALVLAYWSPLGDEIMSPGKPVPHWILVGCGLTGTLIPIWLLIMAGRRLLAGPGGEGLAAVTWVAGGAALGFFGLFGYFNRPFGAPGPAAIPDEVIAAGAVVLDYVLISTPLLWRWIRHRRGIDEVTRGLERWTLEQRAAPGIATGAMHVTIVFQLLRALTPRIRRYGAWVLVGFNLAAFAVLAAAAVWGIWTVLWPARAAVPHGALLAPAGLALIAVGAALGVAAAVRKAPSRHLATAAAVAASLGFIALVAIGFQYLTALARVGAGSGVGAASAKMPLALTIPILVALALLPLSALLLAIRYFFTFFSTVSIGGVAIGSMALVIVLSVMSGFETDLRRKILGSNAHILVTKASDRALICRALPEVGWRRCTMDVEAAFTDYRAVGDQVADTRGVVAQSPYLISEVVIAANNNYANVIIKGVDPETVGDVGELDESTESPDDLAKLWPLHEDGEVRGPPDPDEQAPGGPIPAPEGPDAGPDELPDLPEDDLPLDLSGGVDAGPADQDQPPPDLDLPDDAVPLDLSGGTDAGAAAGADADDIFTLDVPMDEDGYDPELYAPGAIDAGKELTAKIPPRIAVLPGVLVGKELVKQINLYGGQEVKVISPLGQDTPLGPVPRTKPYRVAGVFFTGMYEYDLKYIYVEVGSLQNFLDLGDEVTGIEVRVRDPAATGEVVAALNERLGPQYRVQDWKELNRSLFSALKLEKIAMFLVLGIIILVASFSIVGNLIMVVIEKAREIAVLKTLGASDPAVMKIFVTQGFFIGLVGTLVGVGLGLLACWAGIVYGLPLDPDVYYIDKLPIHIEPMSVLAVAAAGVVISVVATLYPAYIAARLRPVRGLRYE